MDFNKLLKIAKIESNKNYREKLKLQKFRYALSVRLCGLTYKDCAEILGVKEQRIVQWSQAAYHHFIRTKKIFWGY